MKRIMHIVQSPGGVERYIQMFLKYIDKSKYINILVCSQDYNKEYYLDYVSAFEYVEMIREVDPISDFKSIVNVRKFIKKYKPDIVYCHSSKAGAIGRIADIGLHNRVFYNPHGWSFNMECSRKKKAFYQWVEHWLARLTYSIIAISDYERESALENHICKPEKIKVIYNGIDLDDYDQKFSNYHLTRKDLNIPEEAYVIGYVGRLSKQKAPDIFIRAAAKIKEKISDAYFLMVGAGEEQLRIEQLIAEFKLQDCVHITGWVDNPIEYVMLFDQAMLLSRWEGFGLVLAEYMWAKKPIVATKVDAIPELITDGFNGLLVEKDDVKAVEEAALRIYKDKKLSEKMCEEGKRIVVERFSMQRVIIEHDNLFETKTNE